MYVPKIPHLSDPYDREWMILVGIFFIVITLIGLLNIVIGIFVS